MQIRISLKSEERTKHKQYQNGHVTLECGCDRKGLSIVYVSTFAAEKHSLDVNISSTYSGGGMKMKV